MAAAADSAAEALPVGMHLVSVLDEADERRTPSGNLSKSTSALLDGEAQDVEMDMEIDIDVFRPSAMLDVHLDDAFGDAGGCLYGSCFQPAAGLGEADLDIEQMLLCGADDVHAGSPGKQFMHHQHQTAPGQGCQCRTFAIHANRVQAQTERATALDKLPANKRRVLSHTFGAGKRLQGFGFSPTSAQARKPQQPSQRQHQDVEMAGSRTVVSPPAAPTVKREPVSVMVTPQALRSEKQHNDHSGVTVKQEILSTPERLPRQWHRGASYSGEVDEEKFLTPLRRSLSVPAGPSTPITSANSFVSLEDMLATPLSTTSRCTTQTPEPPVMGRSLSPADELEKMAVGSTKAKMNVLRGNFQVSPGHDAVPLAKPTPMLPPPYFRGARDSPQKRRAHSKTFNSFAQSLSFSFSDGSPANR